LSAKSLFVHASLWWHSEADRCGTALWLTEIRHRVWRAGWYQPSRQPRRAHQRASTSMRVTHPAYSRAQSFIFA